MKEPTAVLAAPAPSVRFSVAVVPETVTLPSVPADGALESVQPEVQGAAQLPRVLLNVTTTWSTLPLWSLSNIWSVCRTGALVSIVHV